MDNFFVLYLIVVVRCLIFFCKVLVFSGMGRYGFFWVFLIVGIDVGLLFVRFDRCLLRLFSCSILVCSLFMCVVIN